MRWSLRCFTNVKYQFVKLHPFVFKLYLKCFVFYDIWGHKGQEWIKICEALMSRYSKIVWHQINVASLLYLGFSWIDPIVWKHKTPHLRHSHHFLNSCNIFLCDSWNNYKLHVLLFLLPFHNLTFLMDASSIYTLFYFIQYYGISHLDLTFVWCGPNRVSYIH